MTVYVVSGNEIEKGTFQSFSGDTVYYRTPNGTSTEHARNVFFKKKNAQYQLMRTLGIFRPILNGVKA